MDASARRSSAQLATVADSEHRLEWLGDYVRETPPCDNEPVDRYFARICAVIPARLCGYVPPTDDEIEQLVVDNHDFDRFADRWRAQ